MIASLQGTKINIYKEMSVWPLAEAFSKCILGLACHEPTVKIEQYTKHISPVIVAQFWWRHNHLPLVRLESILVLELSGTPDSGHLFGCVQNNLTMLWNSAACRMACAFQGWRKLGLFHSNGIHSWSRAGNETFSSTRLAVFTFTKQRDNYEPATKEIRLKYKAGI